MAKYTKKSAEKVEEALHEMHKGELKIGKSNKLVKNPKQAIAIGLSEAEKEETKNKKKTNKKKTETKKANKKDTEKWFEEK